MKKSSDALRTISEVSDELDVPKHVLRFWESKFTALNPMKRGGRRRYYRPSDITLLKGIRHLLYQEGFTIRGVQQIFKREGVDYVKSFPGDPAQSQNTAQQSQPDHLKSQLNSDHDKPAMKNVRAKKDSPEKAALVALKKEIVSCRQILASINKIQG